MRIATKLCLFGAMAILLSSCLEITQYAGLDKNNLILDTRFSIQKALLAMSQSAGGEDPSTFLDSIDLDALRSAIPPSQLLAAEKFETELELGVSFGVQYDPRRVPDWDETALPVFLPRIEGKTLVVDLKAIDSSADTEGNAIAAAIMSGFKYRLFIGRSLLAAPKTAFIVSGQEKAAVTLIKYPEFSVVEISMAYLFSASGPFTLVVE